MKTATTIFGIIFLLVVTSKIHTQSVISTAGAKHEHTNGSLSWTIGEPISYNSTVGNYALTQGFQQPTAIMFFEIDGLSYPIVDTRVIEYYDTNSVITAPVPGLSESEPEPAQPTKRPTRGIAANTTSFLRHAVFIVPPGHKRKFSPSEPLPGATTQTRNRPSVRQLKCHSGGNLRRLPELTA